jgi:IclR family mhp operon transcriptional activator
MPSFEPVTAVVRALTVLRLVNTLGNATLKQLHEESRLHRSTILRMLETLIHERYVVRNSVAGTYSATGKTLLLSNGFERSNHLSRLASPHLHQLRQSIGWPSDLAILDGESMLVIVTSREFNVVALNYRAGARAPVLGSSLGRAFIAFCDAEVRNRLLDTFFAEGQSRRSYGMTSRRKAELMLADVRRNGYATPDPGFNHSSGAGLATGFSVPVLVDGIATASLSVAFLKSALTLKQALRALLPPLRETAATLAKAIAQGG